MNQSKFCPKLVVGIMLALFFGVALYLRIALPYDRVFAADWIKFTSVDAYYHMRLVDNLLQHFPQAITFDPYTFYPEGINVPWPPFFDWLIGSIAWLFGLGSPTQHTVDMVGIYFPAILGALTVIPVYFIGKELFKHWAGVISAGLVAILPGEFLSRSILGFTDHHVAEVLFTSIIMLFLILAVKSARQNQLAFNHLRHDVRVTITKTLIYSLLTGIFLGIYLLTWVGGLLFVFLIFVYFVVQFIIEHLRGESTAYLGVVGTLTFAVATAITMPLLPQMLYSHLYLPSLLIAVGTSLVLCGVSRLMATREIKPAYYVLAVVGLCLAGLAIFRVIDPSLLKSMAGRFSIFSPSMTTTILEAESFFFPRGNFSLSVAWGNYTTGFFLSFISLGILIYFAFKQPKADRTLFIVWSLVILAATLGKRRFAYYFTINVALLTGYFSWLILEFAAFRESAAEPLKTPKKARKKAKRKKMQENGSRITASQVKMALAVIVVFFLCFFPNISLAMNTTSQSYSTPRDAWIESLSWLKDNTPPPSDDPDFYYELYMPPPLREGYQYPESAYGVMAWWDYGHWITRIAHRIPISNPFQKGASEAASFFTDQNETSANKKMDKLGARYVIIDQDTAIGKLHGLATFAGRSKDDFYDVYYRATKDGFMPAMYFYPEYYRLLVVRLYNFDADEITTSNSTVISYEEKLGQDGESYKTITSLQVFPSYEEAEAYISSKETGNYRIVSENPFISPVPLKALDHYRLVYSSDSYRTQPGVGEVPEVKIFKYIK